VDDILQSIPDRAMRMWKVIAIISIIIFTQTAAADDLKDSSASPHYPSLVASLRAQSAVDFCGETVPLEIQDIRERLEKEMLLTLADRAQVILWMKRSPRFMPIIEKMLAEYDLPDDLKYVAIAESALRPHVGSPAGAIGFWQFMRATARNYGLAVNSDMDERRNIFKSTLAAIGYFDDLYADLGSWTLAAAAFNMGEEGLKSEILLQKTNDYHRLYLPLETQRYIFRIISAKLILQNPQKYGFQLTEKDLYPPLEFDQVEVHCAQRTPIRLIAQAAGTYFKKIKDLNPDIRGYYLPEGTHAVLVPKGAAPDFYARYEKAFTEWQENPDRQIHVVKPGDNLSSIAAFYKVPLPAILIWNGLNPRKHIHPNDRLIIYSPIRIPEEEKPE
jgi:hypothetical protein